MNFNKGNSVTFVVIKFTSGKREYFMERPKRNFDGRDVPLAGVEEITEKNLSDVTFDPIKDKKLIEKCMKQATYLFTNVKAFKRTVVIG